ncbi:MAG TPA: hypothetical protein VGQ46_08505 [Thermoanaerobaculia bacterium]|jgi:hypothetical protein|nr:hypothetical protein [Thermoanaerobaculia bacterium]
MKLSGWQVAQASVLIASLPLIAAPAHVIRFTAPDAHRAGSCDTMGWGDVLTLFNTTNVPVTVRVLGISNGTPETTAPDHIDLPPGVVVQANLVLGAAWQPRGSQSGNVWMMHLDVPDGVVMESRNEMFDTYVCNAQRVELGSLGKVSLPIFRDAVPANQPQVHLGTDLGSKIARINVGIYNQAQVIANAHVEVRRSCDNAVVDSRDVQIPADTVLQVTGLQQGHSFCSGTPATQVWLQYTVVTVDQPSMTFTSVISGQLNTVPGLAPEVGLGTPFNARY